MSFLVNFCLGNNKFIYFKVKYLYLNNSLNKI